MKNTEGLQQAALAEYGADLHVALRSRKDELLYLRKLTELLFPYVMPPKATDCRYISHTMDTTVQKFRVSMFYVMFLKEVSYSHQGCIYLKKYSKKRNILKLYIQYTKRVLI